MGTILADVVAGALAFLATNVDDFLLLALLFATRRAPGSARRIVAGQYLGIAVLTLAGGLGALLALALHPVALGGLGLLPLALGLRDLVRLRRRGNASPTPPDRGPRVLQVAGLTIASGADNIAVYMPLFASAGPHRALVVCLVFAVLVGVWCAVARAIALRPEVTRRVDRAGHVVAPLALIGLGVAILWRGGTLAWLWGRV